MSPDQRETLATVQMLRFPSPAGLKETPTTRGRRHRWSVYLSICLLMPALAAMIGIVAWAISIEVANESTANLIAASQQSKLDLQKQQQQQQHKLSYLHLKRANQAALDDQSSTMTWAKQQREQPVASAVVVGEAAAAPSDEEARWQARLAAKRASGARRRVLPEAQAAQVSAMKKLDSSQGTATLLITNIDQLNSEGQSQNAPDYSTGSKLKDSNKQSDTAVGQETGSPTEAIDGPENPESTASGRGKPARSEMMSGEAPVDIIASNAWTTAKASKKKAAAQWLHHQRDHKVAVGKLPVEVSLDAHGLEKGQLNENNKALMKKLESVSGGKFGVNKQILIKQSASTKVDPQLSEPVIVTTTDSIDSTSLGEEEDATLQAKSDGLIDYSAGSVPSNSRPIEEDELANNGASGSNNDSDEELGYAAIASAISTSLASDSASTEKPHTSGFPHPHLEGDTGRESRVSSGWSSDETLPGAGRRRSAGENVAQVIDHIVERRKQSSNNLKGPQIVVVAPVGQSMMRAQSLTLELPAEPNGKQHLPPVQLDRRISSASSELKPTPMTGVISEEKKKQLTNVRVKRNRPIGARLLGTGIEETTGVANRRMDGAAMPNGMRFSERIQVIEDDDSSALIGGATDAGGQQRIQERGEPEEVVDMVESSKVPVSAALEPPVAAEPNQASLMVVSGEPRFSRQARHEPRQLTANGDARASNKLYLAEQVVREHVLRAQQRADKSIVTNSQVTSAQQTSPGVSDRKRASASLAQSAASAQPFSMVESASSIRSVSTGDSVGADKQQQQQLHRPNYQSTVTAPRDLPHNNFMSQQLSDQEFNVPAHLAESVIRQIERAPVEMIPLRGSDWPQFVMQHSPNGLQTPYVSQQQQTFLSASASQPMTFWRQQYQQPMQSMQQHYIQPSATEHQLARMQQLQPEQPQVASGSKWGLSGNRLSTTNEQRSISTRAAGPQMVLRHWLNSLRGHKSSVPIQQPAQARMPEPNQLDAAQPEAPIDISRYATKTQSQAEQQQVAPQQELQEVQDSYEQMSYQMPPSYGAGGAGYDMHPPRPHYGGGDDNEKKSKGLTFHFGGGPIGGGSQLITSPMGIFKHLMIPLLPNPRVNLNGKVVFGVVLEKSTAFGEPKKKFKFWG